MGTAGALDDFDAVGLAAQEVLLVAVEGFEQEQGALASGMGGEVSDQFDKQGFLQGNSVLQRRKVGNARRSKDGGDDLADGLEVPAGF